MGVHRSGPGEANHAESTPPPSVKSGRLGGLEQCSNQDSIEESGLKGGAGDLPTGTAGMIQGVLSKAEGAKGGGL